MEPLVPGAVPTGGEAGRAWRELSPEQRKLAWAAAKVGAAPPDGALAAVMAGYGTRAFRRAAWAPVAGFAIFLALCVGLAVLQIRYDGSAWEPWLAGVSEAAAPLLAVVVILGASLARLRYRKLAAAGRLGLEAARAGAVPAGSLPVPAHQSEFTVPYGVLPQAAPLGASGSLPLTGVVEPGGEPGVVVLRNRRARAVVAMVALAFFALYGVFGILSGTVLRTDGMSAGRLVSSVVGGLAALVLLAFVLLIVLATGRAVRNPILARFTPGGWELPASGLSGDWSAVRALEVRAVAAGSLGSSAASSTRLVVFRFDSPEPYLAQLGPLHRRLARAGVRRHGSPVVIAAGPRAPMQLDELLATLARYTDAPVRWT